jgi:hypothetical protein
MYMDKHMGAAGTSDELAADDVLEFFSATTESC